MTHIFYSTKTNIIEALNEIDDFISKMNIFINKNEIYDYNISIKKMNDKPIEWETELKIYKKDVEVS
jgi:hypothetical protein